MYLMKPNIADIYTHTHMLLSWNDQLFLLTEANKSFKVLIYFVFAKYTIWNYNKQFSHLYLHIISSFSQDK